MIAYWGEKTMGTLAGFSDETSVEIEKIEYMADVFSSVVRGYAYERLHVPTIESASSFDESIVGDSPWPEWDKRGCFYLSVTDYDGDFDTEISNTEALLIPEGTISVTRWIGQNYDQIEQAFPKRIFYMLQCFRNELVDKLNLGKRREFNQFGVEILGSDHISADAEVLIIISECLNQMGVKIEEIRCRISDVGIFLKLSQECGLDSTETIMLKEILDNLAEIRAGKTGVGELSDRISSAWAFLKQFNLNVEQRRRWSFIIESGYCQVTDSWLLTFGENYREKFEALFLLQETLAKLNIEILIDLCVVRSHEYYTGISFEVDIITENASFFEIAGGGRYNRLVENFQTEAKSVPSSGFAFGMQRLRECLSQIGAFNASADVTKSFSFTERSADFVINDPDGTLDGYVASVRELHEKRSSGERWAWLSSNQVDNTSLVTYSKALNARLKMIEK